MLYEIVKWLHVLLAIAALGANITYGLWIARASRSLGMLPFVLRGVKILDDRIANPAYGLLLITGVAMVFIGDLSFRTAWIEISLAMYVIVVLVAALGFTPTLRKQIRLVESLGPDSAEYQAAARRGNIIGIVLVLLVIAITYFMVVKPTLWD